jgi:uncharacterized protein (UPF0332 family)
MTLEEMALRGELVREDPTSGEIARLMTSIERRLADAANTTNHPETRFEQAYHAIFNCGWTALRVEGVRAAKREGQHVVVLQSLADTLGIDGETIDYFLAISRQRSKDLYEATPIPLSDAEEAIAEAEKLTKKLKKWLEVRGVEQQSPPLP